MSDVIDDLVYLAEEYESGEHVDISAQNYFRDALDEIRRLEAGMSALEKVVTMADKHTIALEELANKVVNLANKLDEHLNERDAHNPGTMRAK